MCVLWGKKIISEIFTSFHLFSHAVYQNVEPALLARIHYKGQPWGGFLCVQLLSLSSKFLCSYFFVSNCETYFIWKIGNRKDAAACLTHALRSFSTSAQLVRWTDLQQSLETPILLRIVDIWWEENKSFDIVISGWFASLLHSLFEVSFWSLYQIFETLLFSIFRPGI